MILTQQQVKEIVSQAGETDLPAWEESFIADLHWCIEVAGECILTARQEEQLTRIKEQYLMGTKPKRAPMAAEKPAGRGHNKPPKVAGVDNKLLLSVVERVEKLDEEKSGIAADIRDVYAEAKGNGLDTKVIRKIVNMRKRDEAERQEEELIMDTYLRALGMI